MIVVETIDAFRAVRPTTGTLGFVPTMGYLHAGHLALVERARAENGSVAASIFVNPTQFGPSEDFERYPRDLPRDLNLLEAAGVDLVFVPAVREMYPDGFSTYVEVEGVTRMLEGGVRPGHFRGVATIVCKLLNIADAERAYFGQKDAQQTVVIRRMVRDLNIRTEIVVVPTVREPDGLALSSRNAYLSPEERAAAPVLYRALEAARTLWEAGERNGAMLREHVQAVLAQEPLACVDYVSVADPLTLEELDTIGHAALVSLAVRFGKTRLIDNMLLGSPLLDQSLPKP
jgi:pantoate--beta-alanine ligase